MNVTTDDRVALLLVAIYLAGCLACFAVGRLWERRHQVRPLCRVYVADLFPHIESARQISARLTRFGPPGGNGRALR